MLQYEIGLTEGVTLFTTIKCKPVFAMTTMAFAVIAIEIMPLPFYDIRIINLYRYHFDDYEI